MLDPLQLILIIFHLCLKFRFIILHQLFFHFLKLNLQFFQFLPLRRQRLLNLITLTDNLTQFLIIIINFSLIFYQVLAFEGDLLIYIFVGCRHFYHELVLAGEIALDCLDLKLVFFYLADSICLFFELLFLLGDDALFLCLSFGQLRPKFRMLIPTIGYNNLLQYIMHLINQPLLPHIPYRLLLPLI